MPTQFHSLHFLSQEKVTHSAIFPAVYRYIFLMRAIWCPKGLTLCLCHLFQANPTTIFGQRPGPFFSLHSWSRTHAILIEFFKSSYWGNSFPALDAARFNLCAAQCCPTALTALSHPLCSICLIFLYLDDFLYCPIFGSYHYWSPVSVKAYQFVIRELFFVNKVCYCISYLRSI